MAARRLMLALCSLTASLALGSPALAGEGAGGAGTVYTKDTYPTDLPSRPLTLPAGTLEVNVPVNVNFSQDEVGKPVTLTPSIFYGVGNDLTLGIHHGIAFPLFTYPARGLCVTGTDNGCPKVYDDIGALAIYSLLRSGNYQLVLLGGASLNSFDPVQLALQAGVGAKASYGPFALVAQGVVGFGITNREPATPGARTNKEYLSVYVEPQLEIVHGLAAVARVGLAAPFDGFGDAYQIPLGLAVEFTPMRQLDVGVEFMFENLMGKNGTADLRTGTAYARVRF